ncbi:MAG: hypothetical protein HY975_03700 [Candidatus Kerfeldbacteria bacterium]|nr:hypothetical protein [Candidatus Kerfeldbacteria bacterium]
MAQSTSSRAVAFLLREFVGDVLYFPVWWYTRGLALTWRTLSNRWLNLVNRLSLRILLKNMGKPMYGDYTRSGRIISFFFRIMLVVVRLVVLGLWTVVEIAMLGLWVAGPAVAIGMLIRQLIPSGS